MNPQAKPPRESAAWGWIVLAAAVMVAVVSAHDFAASWNDGSRLATAEALVDYHTWSIDRSVFLHPGAVAPGAPAPYPPTEELLTRYGTLDKLLINGHYYSDKSPTPSLWLAAVYAVLEFLTGWTARTHADAFCYVLTLASSGLAYVAAVWSVWRFGRALGLPRGRRLLLTAGFALTTVALPYARHVNNHVFLLGVVAALLAEMAWLAQGAAATGGRMLRLGLLAGLSYGIDVGTGPLLLGGAAVWLAWRLLRPPLPSPLGREGPVFPPSPLGGEGPVFPPSPLGAERSGVRGRAAPLALFVLAAAPWVVLHHGLNYAIGGTLGPANGNPAYFDWPGSPFNAHTMTGVWAHKSVRSFVLYALDLLAGKQGFLGHNLALWLAVPACWQLCLRRSASRPEALLAAFWCVGIWLLYSVTSTNHSGVCCSIRWFVPLLAPAFYVLAVWLRDCPAAHRRDFVILSAWGLALGGLMWWAGPWGAPALGGLMGWAGPWTPPPAAGYWAIQAAALTSWLASIYLRWREGPAEAAAPAAERRAA